MTEVKNKEAMLPTISAERYQTVMTACLLGGVFFLPLFLTVAVALLSVAGMMLLGRMVWSGKFSIHRTPLDLWVAGFVVLAAVSVSQSVYAKEGWYNYFCLVGLYILVYVLITQSVGSKADGKRIIMAILASSAVVCVWGLWQYNAGIDVTAERWIDDAQFPGLKTRVFSTLGNPNILAAFLIMVVGLASGWVLGIGQRKISLALISLSGLAVVCILLTYSRGAWLTLGVMAVLIAAVWKHWTWKMVAAGALITAGLWAAAQESFLTRLLSIRGMFNSADSSVALRWALWESTLAMVQEHPWLGLGWGSYRFVYPEYDFFVQNESVIIYHGHNTLLSLAAEIGIPGMLCFAILWGMSVVRALLAMKNADKGDKGLYFGIALALLGMAAFSLTDHVLFNIQVAAVFWALVALTAHLPIRRLMNKDV